MSVTSDKPTKMVSFKQHWFRRSCFFAIVSLAGCTLLFAWRMGNEIPSNYFRHDGPLESPVVEKDNDQIEEDVSPENVELPAVYHFDDRANTFLAALFPSRMTAKGVSKAYLDRGKPPPPESMDDVHLYRVMSINTAHTRPVLFTAPWMPLDSYWLTAPFDSQRLRQFGKRWRKIEDLAASIRKANPKFDSVIEKALFQRDLVAGLQALMPAVRREPDPQRKAEGEQAITSILELLRPLLLTPDDYRGPATASPVAFG